MENIFKQLPLNGNKNDYANTLEHLKGYEDLVKSIMDFYIKNKDINPRQLDYIVSSESRNISLDSIIFNPIQ